MAEQGADPMPRRREIACQYPEYQHKEGLLAHGEDAGVDVGDGGDVLGQWRDGFTANAPVFGKYLPFVALCWLLFQFGKGLADRTLMIFSLTVVVLVIVIAVAVTVKVAPAECLPSRTASPAALPAVSTNTESRPAVLSPLVWTETFTVPAS